MREIAFVLIDGNDAQTAHPIYGNDFGITTEREQSQIFFRSKLSTALKFVDADYTWIMSRGFDALISLHISVYDNGVTTFSWNGTFARTNCTINEVDKIISVTPEVSDKYNDILGSLDREINLADYAIPTTVAKIPIPAVVQFYQLRQNFVLNYWQGMTWSTEVDDSISRSALLDISFYNTFGYCDVTLTSGITAEFPPTAFVRQYGQSVNLTLTDGTYTLDLTITESGYKSAELFQGGTSLGTFQGSANDGVIDDDGQLVCYIHLGIVELYVRTIQGNHGATEIGTFAQISTAYRYASPLDLTKGIDVVLSTNFVNYATKYGEVYINGAPTGTYYYHPADSTYSYLPIMQNYWSARFSAWIRIKRSQSQDIDLTSDSLSIKYCYEISDLLRAFKTALGLSYAFYPSDYYSQFLYSATPPVSGWPSGFKIVFTAKSNVINPRATEPASKIPCTLNTLFNFLKNALNVYWSMDGGDLKLEHISYYKKGGTYSGTPVTAFDLTQLIAPRSGKPYAYGQNQYQFEKYQMPEFVKWQWMDATDEFFDGSGFQCMSNYVQKGRTEETTIMNITSNINAMIMQTDEISLDGLAVIFLADGAQTDYTQFTRDELPGAMWRAANGELAMWRLQPGVLLYNAPCDRVRASGILHQHVDYVRTKYNDVTFPAQDVDPIKHITTNVGDGAVDSVTNSLVNQSVKVKLKYPNE